VAAVVHVHPSRVGPGDATSRERRVPVTALLVLPAGTALGPTSPPDAVARSLDVLSGNPAVSAVRQVTAGGELAHALRAAPVDDVVLLSPAWPVPTGEAVAAVLSALGGDPGAAAAVAVLPVTDSLKLVGPDDVLGPAADRDRFVAPAGPAAYRPALLPPGPGPQEADTLRDAEALPAALLALGARVLAVPVTPR
jgi:hypothetical protein